MSAEFKVGQTIREDDYARLPIGAKTVWKHCADSDGLPAEKVNVNAWREGTGLSAPIRTDAEMSLPRTLTYLPDAPEPEDTDDVEPEPLQAGDAVLVWATVDHVRGERIGLHFEDDTNDDFATASADAIVRPSAGQVPPWVKAEQDEAKAIRAIKTALVVDGGMHDDRYTQQTAESLYRAGIRATKGGAS